MLVACAALFAATARAETEAIRIEYRSEPDCPSEPQFRAQVLARAPSARLASGTEEVRTFVVSIERRSDGFAGSLVIRESGKQSVAREVADAQCAEVATALSLATALAIDPLASPELQPETAPAKGPDRPPSKRSEAPLVPPERTHSWNAALGPRLESGISPRVALGGSAELEWHTRASAEPVSSVGIELSWLEASTYPVSTASSSFRFLLTRPLGCSFVVRLPAALQLSPCLGVELGAVTGTGSGLPAAETATRFWMAAELLGRLRFQPGDSFFVDVDGALVLPITRYQFVFRAPDTSIYAVPALAVAASARVGLRLW
jgi:hypothetical protein